MIVEVMMVVGMKELWCDYRGNSDGWHTGAGCMKGGQRYPVPDSDFLKSHKEQWHCEMELARDKNGL